MDQSGGQRGGQYSLFLFRRYKIFLGRREDNSDELCFITFAEAGVKSNEFRIERAGPGYFSTPSLRTTAISVVNPENGLTVRFNTLIYLESDEEGGYDSAKVSRCGDNDQVGFGRHENADISRRAGYDRCENSVSGQSPNDDTGGIGFLETVGHKNRAGGSRDDGTDENDQDVEETVFEYHLKDLAPFLNSITVSEKARNDGFVTGSEDGELSGPPSKESTYISSVDDDECKMTSSYDKNGVVITLEDKSNLSGELERPGTSSSAIYSQMKLPDVREDGYHGVEEQREEEWISGEETEGEEITFPDLPPGFGLKYFRRSVRKTYQFEDGNTLQTSKEKVFVEEEDLFFKGNQTDVVDLFFENATLNDLLRMKSDEEDGDWQPPQAAREMKKLLVFSNTILNDCWK